MQEDSDEVYIRKCSASAVVKMLRMFQEDDFEKIYTRVHSLYWKHYAPTAKEKNRKEKWPNRRESGMDM